MRSIWKGSINFGMVAIPAKLYTATDDRRIPFHQIHSCGSRIQMPKWCPSCDRKVETTEIKKGYEINKDQHIIIEEGEFNSLPLKSLKTIEVVEFVHQEIDPRYYDSYYFLSCEDVGGKAFRLFWEVMNNLAVVGVAKLGYREREHLSLIRPYHGGIMLLHTLHYADEIRPFDEIKPKAVQVSDREREMAQMLVKALSQETFEYGKYRDNYREALEKLIEAKISGETLPITAETPVPSGDVAEALLASLKMVGAR